MKNFEEGWNYMYSDTSHFHNTTCVHVFNWTVYSSGTLELVSLNLNIWTIQLTDRWAKCYVYSYFNLYFYLVDGNSMLYLMTLYSYIHYILDTYYLQYLNDGSVRRVLWWAPGQVSLHLSSRSFLGFLHHPGSLNVVLMTWPVCYSSHHTS